MMNYKSLSKDEVIAVKIIAFVVLCVIGLAIWLIIAASATQPSKITLCDPASETNTHHIYLIDTSDVLTSYQKDFLQSEIRRNVEDAKTNDRFSIYKFNEKNTGLSDPIVDLCKPRNGENANMLYENGKIMHRKYDEQFNQPITAVLENIVSLEEMAISPIQESLEDISTNKLGDKLAKYRHISIFSDMLQNTARASVYSNGVATIKSLPKFNLKDYTVDVFWLDNPRHKALQNTALAQEWANYIDAISSLGKIQKVR